MAGHRRGTYLTDAELSALGRLARDSGLTGSSVLRIGLRRLAGLPVPRRELDALGATPPATSSSSRVRHDYSAIGF